MDSMPEYNVLLLPWLHEALV